MLIDTGEREHADKLIEYIESRGISRIDVLVGSHPHSDHIGGMAQIIRHFEIGEVLMPNVQHSTRLFEDMLDALIEKDLSVRSPLAGERFMLGSAAVEVLSPHRTTYDRLNNHSIVFRITYGEHAFLFMGDAEIEAEADILAMDADISANVLKVGHHGSITSTSSAFLTAVAPDIAIISVGAGNIYGHPSNTILSRLRGIGATVFRTDLCGNIVIRSDGETLEVLTSIYIGNVNTQRFHFPNCSFVPLERNRRYFNVREDAIKANYLPCRVCNP
jgi:competence protein ComEC